MKSNKEMAPKTYKLWQKRILSRSPWRKAEINALTKLLASARWDHGSDRSYDIEQLQNSADFKHEWITVIGYNGHTDARFDSFEIERSITKEQTKFGIEWLNNFCFKKDGTARDTKNNLGVGERHIVKKFKRFAFIGVLGHTNGMRQREVVAYSPIYRVYSEDGFYFDYSPLHWGNPVIVGRAHPYIRDVA